MTHPSSLSDLAAVLDELDANPSSRHIGGEEINSPIQSEGSFLHVESPSRHASSPALTEGELHSQPSSTTTLLPAAVLESSQEDKRYHLWRVPDTFEDGCFRLIGQGGSFCTRENCNVTHKSTKHFHPLPGEIYVKRSPTTAFIAPSISSTGLQGDLIESWFKSSATIMEWHRRFSLAKHEEKYPILRLPEEKISEVDIKAKEVVMLSTLAYKTPAKRSKVSNHQLQMDLPQFETLSNPVLGIPDQLEPFNDKLITISKALELIYVTQQKDARNSIEGLHHSDARTTKLEQELGSPPHSLDEEFQAPNLWLTIGALAEQIKLGQKLLVSLNDSVKIDKSSSQDLNLIFKQVSDLNAFAVDAVRKLNAKINTIPNVANNHDMSAYAVELDKRESRLLQRFESLEVELSSLRAAKDSTVIKFGQLGFRTQLDCTSWLQTHHPADEFGLLVDFHLVMEHVFVQINGQKLLANLEKIYKMDLKSNNQALAISSFETRLPRFFTQDSKLHVRRDESYFHGIKSWDEWDLPNDGFRDRLNVELHLFKVGHQETLENELTHLSPFHNLCVLALTESVAWVDSLVKFIDDTYNEYSRSRYGTKKAWNITTRLAKSLIEKVATPRNSIHNSFKIKNPAQVSKAITYASLRSLDLMMTITQSNFKNSPIITAELSKYLALNTNYEAVEQVQKKLSTMESDNATLKKDVKSAISSANTAGNKFDSTIKPQLEDFKKRIRALESRN